MIVHKKGENLPILVSIALIWIAALANSAFIKEAYGSSDVCQGVYASNPIIYALYLKAKNRPINKRDITTYTKIVNPAKYMHDRYNPFLGKKLFLKDKSRLKKLMYFINSVKYFRENVTAGISNYSLKKHGVYLTYYGLNKTIKDKMKTRRNINFIKIRHNNIYYLFHNLTIVHKNAGNFSFLAMPENKAEDFINKRTGTFGHIKKSVFLEYYFTPLRAKNDILTVKVVCVKIYNSKHKNLLIGTIK